MDWTIFWTIFFYHFIGGGTPLVIREGWDTVYQYWGRDGWQSVITQGGVRDGLLLRSEGWEVVVMVNTTGWWSFYSIVQITSIGFSTEFFVSQNFCAGPQRFFSFLSCESKTATWTLDFNFYTKYRVYDPPLLSYACAFWVDLCTISCFKFPFVCTVCNY